MIRNCTENTSDFQTVLCQIEEVINRRPISYCTGNESEILPLTPWNFLILNCSDNAIEFLTKPTPLISSFIDNNKIVLQFWKRWKLEYLPTLITNKSKACVKEIKIGDVVLLNECAKREYWPLARVIEVFKGHDGIVRSVKLKCRGKILTRPTKLIYLLESSTM